jgi:hypothetical protein
MAEFTTPETPPPAPDLPPENAFDPAMFWTTLTDELKKRGIIDAQGHLKTNMKPGWLEKEFLSILADMGVALGLFLELLLAIAQPFLEQLVISASKILDPAMRLLGDLTSVYVHTVGGIPAGEQGGKLPVGPGPTSSAAGVVFDKIMGPMLHILTPGDPRKQGAGEENAQAILGTIVNLHLSTWAVNVISNLTGMGYLKWINSFDDAILSGINARGFSRLASKPYLDKFVVRPLSKDLNRAYPVDFGSTSQLVKRYIRGNMTEVELKAELRKLGFDDAVAEDLLLDSIRFLSLSDVAWLVNTEKWQPGEAVTYLEHQGYPAGIAPVALFRECNARIESQMYSLASSLVDAFVDRRLDNPTLRRLLKSAGLPHDEIEAYSTRGAILQELSKRLSLSQVKSLFQEGLVDLDYVMRFLQDEGYGADEVDLLALLEFTRKEDREQRKADLLERRRVALEAQLGFEEQADAARLEELASLGGPTS